jgi:CubicO group peptidase (beta-lactamase class C family)
MKYLLLLVPLTLLAAGFWFMEPFANNPFYNRDLTEVSVSEIGSCKTHSSDIEEQARSLLKNYSSNGEFLGVSAGVLKGDCGLVVATGYRDKRNLTPFAPDTISRIASITKPMTAIAVMQLYERGKLSLDTPIQTYLPEFPEGNNVVTVRHLLSHTSGVPHYKSALDAMSLSRFESLEAATKSIFERGLVNPAGENYTYSSFGYTLLGRVIEVVSNENFGDYMEANVWHRAGMNDTSLEYSHSVKNQSRLYVKAGRLFLRSPYTDLSIIYPAGGVLSTAEDLLKFGKAIIEDRLISRDTLEMMIDVTGSLAPEAGDDPYGLGWNVYHGGQNGRIISHGGSQPGVSAHFQIQLDRGIVSLAISNAYGTKRSAHALAIEIGEIDI